MRIAAVADVHANAVALEAVLDDLPDVDAVVCAGDVVGYNAHPAECVDALRERDVRAVMGNHDRLVAYGFDFPGHEMARAGIEHAREALDEGRREWLADLPDRLEAFDDRVAVVHGHPDDADRYTYPGSFGPDLLDGESVLILGHTHVQHHERYDDGVVLNPGSVGQPRDGDPRAAYAVVDLDSLSVEERRVEYDVDRAREAIREAGLPDETGERLTRGR